MKFIYGFLLIFCVSFLGCECNKNKSVEKVTSSVPKSEERFKIYYEANEYGFRYYISAVSYRKSLEFEYGIEVIDVSGNKYLVTPPFIVKPSKYINGK